jgi:hypothetical protein
MHTGVVTGTPQSEPAARSAGRPGPRRILMAGLLLLLVVASSVTTVDRFAEQKYEALFQRAFITFALARTLNGLISAVQGTELALQPAGVGVTLTPGEILDPVNDLVERFSWIMLGSTLSLGVQQVLLDMGQWWGVRLVLAVLALAWLWLRIRREMATGGTQEAPGQLEAVLLRVLLITVFIRFAVPLAMIANEGLYSLFLEQQYVESAQLIETAGAEISRAGTLPEEEIIEEEDRGFFDSIGRGLDNTLDALDLERRVDVISERAGEVVENLIRLSVVFILQTGILPIAFLWIFLQLIKTLLRFSN